MRLQRWFILSAIAALVLAFGTVEICGAVGNDPGAGSGEGRSFVRDPAGDPRRGGLGGRRPTLDAVATGTQPPPPAFIQEFITILVAYETLPEEKKPTFELFLTLVGVTDPVKKQKMLELYKALKGL